MGNLSLAKNGDEVLPPTSHSNIADATGTCTMGCTTASGAAATTNVSLKPSVIPSSGVCPYGHGSGCSYGHGSK